MNRFKRGANQAMKNGGFTLLEVMIAILVLSLGILGMMALQTTSIRSNQQAITLTTATSVASGVLEGLRSRPFNDPQLDPANSPFNAVDPGSGFQISWTVTSPVAGSKLIVVTVNRLNFPPVTYEYIKF